MSAGNHYTTPQSEIHLEDYRDLIRLALEEDMPAGDPTSDSIFSANRMGYARIVSRESGIICGTGIIRDLLLLDGEKTGQTVNYITKLKDGNAFGEGDTLLEFEGALNALFRLERIILNFIQYLSGISTVTERAVRLAGPEITVLDTRKTLPGYRKLAKYAVYCGGGRNHRLHLSDMAMIKDNHIAAAGGIKIAAERVRERYPELPLEIEVDSPEQLSEALSCHPRVVLLDNMDRAQLEDSTKIIHALPESERPLVEVSGGYTPDQLKKLRGLGRLGVSMGSLTHTTRFLDLSMEIESLEK